MRAARTNIVDTFNTSSFHAQGDFDRGRILAGSSTGGFVGFGYGSGSIPHMPTSSGADRRRALASAHFAELKASKRDGGDAGGGGAGSGAGSGAGRGGGTATLKDVDDALKLQERKARKKRHQKMQIKGGMRDARTRIVINSSARSRPSTTTSSDFVVNIPEDLLQTQVYGVEVIGWSLPLSKWTIEPFENRACFRMGRHFEPGCRSISTIYSGSRVTTEMPITWNPITHVSPIARGSSPGVRVRCLYRVGTCLAAFAAHHEESHPSLVPGLRFVSMPFGEDAQTLDDTMRLDPARIVGPRYGDGAFEAEPQMTAAYRGSNMVQDLLPVSPPPFVKVLGPKAVPEDPHEFFYMDESLHARLFSHTDDPVSFSDRMGVPYGWLAAAVPATRFECTAAVARCMSADLRPLGIHVAVPPAPQETSLSDGAPFLSMTFRSPAPSSSSSGGGAGEGGRELELELVTDALGPRHLGLNTRNSPSPTHDSISSSSVGWSRRVRCVAQESETVTVEAGPMRGGIRDVAASLQRAIDAAWYHPLGSPSAPAFAIPVIVETHVHVGEEGAGPPSLTLVSVPSGSYSPREAAFAMQVALRGAFPGMGFEVAERPAGFAFRASVVFALRFDLAKSPEAAAAAAVPDPDLLGYSPRPYSGSMWYEPGERVFRSRPAISARVAPAGFGVATPVPWPFRLRATCDSECKMMVMNAEPLPRVDRAEVLRSWPEAHLALVRTQTAVRWAEGTRVRIVPRMSSGASAADAAEYAGLRDQLASLRDQLLSPPESGEGGGDATSAQAAAALAAALESMLLAAPQTLDSFDCSHETYGNVSEIVEAIASHENTEPVWEPVILRTAVLLRREMLRRAAIDISVWGRALHTSSRSAADFEGEAAATHLPYGARPSEIDLEDQMEDEDQLRTVLLSLSQPSILFSSTAGTGAADPQESGGGSPVDDLQTILGMSESFALHPMNSDLCPLVMDLSSWTDNMIKPEVLGFGACEYVIFRPGEHPRLLESDRDVDTSQQQYILLHIDANASDMDATQVRTFGDRRFEGRPQSLGLSAGDPGSLCVLTSTSEPGDAERSLISATRCTAYVPLGEALTSNFDARATRWFDAPIRLKNVRITTMLPDGRLYPFHGRDVTVALRFIAVSQGVPDESEPEEDD